MPGASDIKAGGAYIEIGSGLSSDFNNAFAGAQKSLDGVKGSFDKAAEAQLTMRKSMGMVSTVSGQSGQMLSQMANAVMMFPGPAGLAAAAILGIVFAWKEVAEASDKATAAMQKSVTETTTALDKAYKNQFGKKEEFNVTDQYAEGNKALQEKRTELQKLKEDAKSSGLYSGSGQLSNAYQTQKAQLEQDVDALEAAQNRYRNAMGPTAAVNKAFQDIHQQEISQTPTGALAREYAAPNETEKAEKQAALYAKQSEALREYVYALQAAGVTGKILADAQEKNTEMWNKAAEAKKKLTDATLKQAEAEAKVAAKVDTDALARSNKEISARESQINAVFEATRTPTEKLNAELERLNDLSDKGMDKDTYTRAVSMALDTGLPKGSDGFSTVGTFSGSAMGEIGASGIFEKQLTAIEEVAKNTAELIQQGKSGDSGATLN